MVVDKSLQKQHYKQIKKTCVPYRFVLCLCFGCYLAISLITIVNALFLQNIISNVASDKSDNLAVDIVLVFVCLVGFALAQFLANVVSNVVMFRCANRFRLLLFNNYLANGDVSQYTSSEVLSRIYEESAAITNHLVMFKMLLGCSVIVVAIILATVFYFAWIIGILMVVVVPLLVYFVNIFIAKYAKSEKDLNSQRAKTRNVVLQGIAGIGILRLLSKQSYYCNIVQMSLATESKPNTKLWHNHGIYQGLLSMINMTLPMVFAALTGVLYSIGLVEGVGTIMLVYLLSGFWVIPLNNIANSIQRQKSSDKTYSRVAPLMEERVDNFGRIEIGDIERVEIDIERYAYDEDKSILQGFGLSLRAGDSVCVVGESGSGKSTLLKLLLNQMVLDTGSIEVNGIRLRDIERESYYRQVGYVQQKSFMFRGSVIDNIALGDSYTQEEIDKVLQECGLREFVDTYGLEKEIDEKNENVSGGQLQRISLARTLIRRPKLILLDEPTASLDSETGVDIVKTLLHRVERDNLILLCVSHDKSVIELFGKTVQIG